MAISTATISIAADCFKPEPSAGKGLRHIHPFKLPNGQPATINTSNVLASPKH
jgi:hypothetical protein